MVLLSRYYFLLLRIPNLTIRDFFEGLILGIMPE